MQPMLSSLLREHSRPTLIDLRGTLREIERTVDGVVAALRDRKQTLSTQYRVRFDALTLKAAAFALLGLTVFGSMMVFFFARMAWDIRRLERRAIKIVNGYRGPALDVSRGDELGALMASVNTMQAELRSREARLELVRQEQLHKEKMAAIGALAAGIAHEINNPIAAIAGVAEEIELTRTARACPHHGAACRPDLILEHTRRVASITRQISHFSSPGATQSELIDLNSLARNTCSFIQYDRRFRGVQLAVELDPTVPAIEAVADPLTQVLMNLLVNAADACETLAPGAARVCVRTQSSGSHVLLIVEDNGCGMDAQTLAQAFDEYFTTKSHGRGSGLGLALCRRLLEPLGATLALESTLGTGARATVRIPVPELNPSLN
jgi:signal transduction histidine kinase